MTTDPMLYILASAIFSGCIGFIGASLMAARQVRQANNEGYKEAVRHFQEEAKRNRSDARRI